MLLSHGYWQRVLAGDQSAIGRDLLVNGRPYTIVGVMPPDFAFLDVGVQLWIPRSFTPEERSEESRYSQNDEQVARLKPGASLEQAQQQFDALTARNLERAGPLKAVLVNAGFHSVVVPMQADLVRNARGIIYLLWGGAMFVLLIAAVNITNLVLVRAHGRLRELATRHALGASRWRMALQLLAETTVTTVLGGALGLLVGAWGLGWLSSIGLAELPRGYEIQMDLSMVGTFSKGQDYWALVRDPEGVIHRVPSGNYMGKNHAKVVGITATQVDLSELISDGADGWLVREASIALGEG